MKRNITKHHGSMLLEVIVSASLIAALLVIINQTIIHLHRQTRFTDRHFIAQQSLENLMEELTHRPWVEITTQGIDALRTPEAITARLPQIALTGDVVLEEDPTPAKRITLRLQWQNILGARQQPLSLTTWIYRQPEANP